MEALAGLGVDAPYNGARGVAHGEEAIGLDLLVLLAELVVAGDAQLLPRLDGLLLCLDAPLAQRPEAVPEVVGEGWPRTAVRHR